jgi:hypothetical protein
VDAMRIKWKPAANNFWLGSLEEPLRMPLKRFDGTYNDSKFEEIGYVAKETDGFVVRYYGSLYSGKHPVERIVFATKADAMATAEKYATAILAAKLLSR